MNLDIDTLEHVFHIIVFKLGGGNHGFRASRDTPPNLDSLSKEVFSVMVTPNKGEKFSDTAKRAFEEVERRAIEHEIYIPGISKPSN